MPVSPYPSCREPTSTVMLTVTLDCELSGNRRSLKPLLNWYSVIPSTDATFLGGSAASIKSCSPKIKKTEKRIRFMQVKVLPKDLRIQGFFKVARSLTRVAGGPLKPTTEATWLPFRPIQQELSAKGF